MKRSMVAAGFVAVVVAAFAWGSDRAEATPIPVQTFNFSGKLISDPGNVTGLHAGDTIAGSLTFAPLVDTYTTSTTTALPPSFPITTTTNSFAESGKFTFGAPGSPIEVDGASGKVDSSITDFFFQEAGLDFSMANGGDSISFGAGSFASSATILTSLSQLPSDSTGIAAFLGGLFFFPQDGKISYHGSEIDFQLAIGATPIPATVWLFASALGGLGLLGWMRRGHPAPAILGLPARQRAEAGKAGSRYRSPGSMSS
jgi:hypothetical protein